MIAVHVLIAAHFVHWKLNGRTLAPLELNEVMHTLELDIVTAGFLFMLLVLVSVLLFGRFFCSWGCHILALEDLCAWALGKVGVRPKAVRSRALLLVPLGAALYMFVWPQVRRMVEGRPAPDLVVFEDGEGWASFLTSDFARNLPGPGIALITLNVCGFVIVYVLDSRSFCHDACPYGALFGLVDRLAPGRIVSTSSCSACALCTAACQSGIRVHDELAAFGTVVNPACLRDLDCIAACPSGAIGYGFTMPPLLRKLARARLRFPFGLSLAEEALVVVTFLVTFLVTLAILRGLYGQVPFLLSLGAGAIVGYGAVLAVRLARRPAVRLGSIQLKLSGKRTRAGNRFVATSVVLASFLAHSALVRYHEYVGHREFERVTHAEGSVDPARLERAVRHLVWTERWGLYARPDVPAKLAVLHERLGFAHAESGDGARAIAEFTAAARLAPGHAPARYNLAVVLAQSGHSRAALEEYQIAARLDPEDADIQNNLGYLLMVRGDAAEAERCFERAIALDAELAHPHFNLGRVLAAGGRGEEAQRAFERAARLDPRYAEILRGAGPGPVLSHR